MAACLCCFRCCWNGSGFHSGHVPLKELPTVKLDTGFMEEDDTENCIKTIKKFCIDVLKVNSDENKLEIDRTHRIGKRSRVQGSKPCPIVVKFHKFSEKEHVRQQSYIEQFPKEIADKRRQLMPVMRREREHGNTVKLVLDRLYINGIEICGTGAALSNAPIAQDKAYFEVKIQSTGVWGVGLATNRCNVNTVPLGNNTESWVLRHDGTLYHNNEQKGKISEIIQEGDIIGFAYNHIELNFFLNVDEGAVIDVQFEGFYHTPPDGFDSILIEKSLL
ncbi:hypothetical protein KUTeg_011568 [Tegillarca granosa]|uniref:SPRY domain-containing protein 7 n=1 Tax=Tegillarca granosa TaxID=220873 RepID=A0ABQ9F2C8_TEGGR|nr:hypothetical protein KUTeg_011568 [Tegillarca granosa]